MPVLLAFSFQSNSGVTELAVLLLIPYCLIGFGFIVFMNIFGLFPTQAASAMNSASKVCYVVAISVLGIKTSFQYLASLKCTPVLMLVTEKIWIALFIMAGNFLLN